MYIWNITNAQTDNSNDITGRPSCQWYSALHKQLLHIHVSSVRLHNDNAWIRSTNSPQVYAGAPPRALRCTFVFSFFLMFFFSFSYLCTTKRGYTNTRIPYIWKKKKAAGAVRVRIINGESRRQRGGARNRVEARAPLHAILVYLSFSLSLSLSLSISLSLSLSLSHSIEDIHIFCFIIAPGFSFTWSAENARRAGEVEWGLRVRAVAICAIDFFFNSTRT